MILPKREIEEKYKLKDGTKAFYSTTFVRDFNLLIFEKDDWQYVLGMDERVSDQVTPKILIDIIQYFEYSSISPYVPPLFNSLYQNKKRDAL